MSENLPNNPLVVGDAESAAPSQQVIEPSRLSLREIIGALTTTQIWGVITTCAVLLSGACYGGFWFKSQLAQDEIDDLKRTFTTLKENYQGLDIKNEFLVRQLRLLNEKLASNQSDEIAAKEMGQFLNRALEQAASDKDSNQAKAPKIRIGRGESSKKSTVTFSDNTSWVLPEEVIKHISPNHLTNPDISKGVEKKPSLSPKASTPSPK
jgi:hypothetical protein